MAPQDPRLLDYEIVDVNTDVELDDFVAPMGPSVEILEDEITQEEIAIVELEVQATSESADGSPETLRMGLATDGDQWQIVKEDIPAEDRDSTEEDSVERSDEGEQEIEPADGIPEEVHVYLTEQNTEEYDGTLADEVGSDSVTIDVGGGDIGFAFTPPVVRVDAGTDVTWEWTGRGGAHNVESTEAPVEFSSGDIVSSADERWTHTFDEPGNYFYHCAPHTGTGMHGAIIVE